MATILCFGDSNTWGAIPNDTRRYGYTERWPALLQSALADVEVIEAGQPGRTLIHNDPFQGEKAGQHYLKDYLEHYAPNLVLILLGSNDLKAKFAHTAKEVAKSAAQLAVKTQQYQYSSKQQLTKVLLISPPPIYEVGFYANMYAGAASKSRQLATYYQQYAQQIGCDFFDAGTVINSCKEEGIHWQVDQHQLLADALLVEVRKLLLNT